MRVSSLTSPEQLDWAVDEAGLGLDMSTLCSLAQYGDLGVLQHAVSRARADVPLSWELCGAAAEGGRLDVLQWLRSIGCPWDETVAMVAARLNLMDMLKWVRANGVDMGMLTAYNAAYMGNFEALKWVHAEGCVMDYRICEAAARRGDLPMLEWARQKGCDWSPRLCAQAALDGHLQLLIWARRSGCPWTELTPLAAVHGGHLDVLAWAYANNCPADMSVITLTAAEKARWDILKWLNDRGLCCPVAMHVAGECSAPHESPP